MRNGVCFLNFNLVYDLVYIWYVLGLQKITKNMSVTEMIIFLMLDLRWLQKTACLGALAGMEEVQEATKILHMEESSHKLAALANPPLPPMT